MKRRPPTPPTPDQAMSCDDALAALALDRGAGSADAAAHAAGCAHCQADRARALQVSRALGRHAIAAPAADSAFQARVLAAAAPLLARRASEARALRRRIVWAFALALLPLPALLFANYKLLVAAHDLLTGWLPPTLSLYVVACLGAGVALLLALSYVAVPVMAARRPWLFAPEEFHVESHVHVPV